MSIREFKEIQALPRKIHEVWNSQMGGQISSMWEPAGHDLQLDSPRAAVDTSGLQSIICREFPHPPATVAVHHLQQCRRIPQNRTKPPLSTG